MSNRRILIIDEMHDSISPLLTQAGFEPVYAPKISRKEMMQHKVQFVGFVVRSKTTIDRELLEGQTELKFIARAGAGVDQVDVPYLASRNITLLNAPEGNRDALGEHVLGMLLCLSNNLRHADMEVRNKVWDREGNRGFEISGKTVGLLGYGYMGSAVAEKLAGFGCRVIAYDKYKENYGDLYAEQVAMEDIFEQSDIFSLHVPLTTETKCLVDLEYLRKFKKPIVFINAARGEVVPLKDLLDALDEGTVRMAALDVLENEKLSFLKDDQAITFNRLIKNDRVLLSPHVGGWSFESYQKINEVLVDKIKQLDLP
ncbi:phosphoglycerate dehydrogenase [Reichenbachiella carrageenanivorans]|uniref:Phosphoglycerate dehydrogenase n=1 Tax=Reichenbachiella carrageenanivorans TaxID=2979869 RepID=A0ABY6CZ86_9BACT|nr:NAD(P)-dependent oxidoreductase [Reichenbachiella carrageenanivorans]UXX79178.1 phosphoglycerate dehydrogenase [Reichenbachiella carrageenanivorans]